MYNNHNNHNHNNYSNNSNLNNHNNNNNHNNTNSNANKRPRKGGNIYGYYRPNYDLNVQFELYKYYVFVNKKPTRYEKELLNRRLPLTMV